jgi:hypothetical protein
MPDQTDSRVAEGLALVLAGTIVLGRTLIGGPKGSLARRMASLIWNATPNALGAGHAIGPSLSNTSTTTTTTQGASA